MDIILRRLQQHQLYVGKKKCSFCQEEKDFLGLQVGKNGIRIGDERTEIIRNWPRQKIYANLGALWVYFNSLDGLSNDFQNELLQLKT